MAKKKVGASVGKRSGGASHLSVAAKDAATDEPAADTVIQVINRRIRAARKKLQKIGTIEEARAEGKEINDDQARTLESRIQVTAILEELVRVEPLVEKALKKEIEIAIASAMDEANTKSDETGDKTEVDGGDDGDEEESTLDSASQAGEEVKAEEAGQLMDLFYVSQVFGLGGTEADFEGFLSEGRTIEDIPVTRQQLQMLASLGKSLLMRSAHDGLTHQEALERCRNMAFGFLRSPDARVDEETTVAEMMELINQIKLSEFFQSMIIEPTPAPQPDPIASDINAHVEPIAAEMVPQMNPAIQHPPSTASGAVNLGAEAQSFDPAQGDSHEGVLDCSPAMPLGNTQSQTPAAASGPRPFLPFPSLPSKPVSSTQTVPSGPNLQSHIRATPPTGFNIQNIPDGIYSSDYSGANPQQQAAPSIPVAMDNLASAKVAPAAEEMQTERNITPTPHADSILHAHDARQGRAEEKPSGGVHDQSVNPSQAHKPNPDHMNELDQRPRGPGRRQRGVDSSHGGSGPPVGSQQFHNSHSGHGTNGGGTYNAGRRGHSGRGGGNWHGYRGDGHGEGRGRGRGRSSSSHYGNWDSGNSHGGRGQAANGFPSRGSGRGNRGGYRGGRGGGGGGGGGGSWRQTPQQAQPTQNAQN